MTGLQGLHTLKGCTFIKADSHRVGKSCFERTHPFTALELPGLTLATKLAGFIDLRLFTVMDW